MDETKPTPLDLVIYRIFDELCQHEAPSPIRQRVHIPLERRRREAAYYGPHGKPDRSIVREAIDIQRLDRIKELSRNTV